MSITSIPHLLGPSADAASGFRRHTRRDRCPVCDKPDWCRSFPDGWTECQRVESDRPTKNNGWLHRTDGGDWRDRPTVTTRTPTAPEPPKPEPVMCDRGLRALLDRCPLSPAHRDDLRARGLTDAAIDALPFGSLPDDETARNGIAAAVVADLGPVAYGNVPGLFADDDGAPRLNAYPGLVVGVEQDGRLVGLVIRPNDAGVRETGKYRWLSSRAKPGGVGSGAPCGVVFPVGWEPGTPVARVIVAEGTLKAYIIANKTGLPVIAMPGARQTDDVPRLVAALGAPEPALAYDNDRLTNDQVADGERKLINQLHAAGFTASRLTWPTAHKGADDALAAGVMPLLEPITATGDTDAAPAAQVAELQAEIRRLRDENQRLRDENQVIISTVINPHLKAEAVTAVRLVMHVNHRRKQGEQPDERGFLPVSPTVLGEDHAERPGVPSMLPIRGRSTVHRHLKNLADFGLAERELRPTTVKKRVVDRNTGEIVERAMPVDETWLKLTGGSIIDMLKPFAVFRRPEPDARAEKPKYLHGGKREPLKVDGPTPCPGCGKHARFTTCADCGADLGDVVAAELAAEAATPPAPSTNSAFHLETPGDEQAAETRFQVGTPKYVTRDVVPSGAVTTRFQDETTCDEPAWLAAMMDDDAGLSAASWATAGEWAPLPGLVAGAGLGVAGADRWTL